MRRGVVVLGGLALAWWACRPNTGSLATSTFACQSSADCTSGFVCDVDQCVRTEDLVPPVPLDVGPGPRITGIDLALVTLVADRPPRVFEAGEDVRVTVTLTAPNGLPRRPLGLLFTEDQRGWRDVVSKRDAGVAFDDATWLLVSSMQADSSFTISTIISAPTSSYFRLKALVRDAAGRRDLAMSDVINVPRWSLYAGAQSHDRGVELDADRLRLAGTGDSYGLFFVDPAKGDLYVHDFAAAGSSSNDQLVYRVAAQTGRTSVVFRLSSTTDVAPDARLAAVPTLINYGPNVRRFLFDNEGRLFVMNTVGSGPALLWLDLDAGVARHYLGGGADVGDNPSPAAANVFPNTIAFDANDTLYYFAKCPGYAVAATDSVRLMKATRRVVDGRPAVGAISHFAGACSRGPFDAGTPAQLAPLMAVASSALGLDVVPVDDRLVYVNDKYVGGLQRILDGVAYPTLPRPQSLAAYDRARSVLVTGRASNLVEFTPSYEPRAAAEPVKLVFASATTGDCTADGRNASLDGGDACVSFGGELGFFPDGGLLFSDGPGGGVSAYRVRTFDEAGRVQTVVGAPPLPSVDRFQLQYGFSSIAAKAASAPNQAAFPAGVYGLNVATGVIVRFESDTHPTRPGGVTVVAGNGFRYASVSAVGSVISANEGLALFHPVFSFDGQGLPVFMLAAGLVRLDVSSRIERLTAGTAAQSWPLSPSIRSVNVQEWPVALHPVDAGIFIGGTTCAVNAGATCTDSPRLRYFPFSGAPAHTVIGGAGRDFTDDLPGPQNVQSATLSESAGSAWLAPSMMVEYPYMQFDEASNRLYFVEGTRLRSVANPLTSNVDGSLRTHFVEPRGLGFFTLNPPGGPYAPNSMVFFIARSGSVVDTTQLYCRALDANAAPWCPPEGVALGPAATNLILGDNGLNSLAWRTPTELLVLGRGVIWTFDAR